jgi:hypothetical protein
MMQCRRAVVLAGFSLRAKAWPSISRCWVFLAVMLPARNLRELGSFPNCAAVCVPYRCGMNTPDTPCTQPERWAVVDAAIAHRKYILWLADHLREAKYQGMLPIGRADIRAAVVIELLQLIGETQ